MTYEEAFAEGTISVREAAEMLCVGKDRIANWVKNQNIPDVGGEKHYALPKHYISYIAANNIKLRYKSHVMYTIITDWYEHEKKEWAKTHKEEIRKSYIPDYASDCIHLHACRLQRSHCKKQFNKVLTMCCTEDCPAYCKGGDESYVTVDRAIEYARDGVSSIRSGYGAYDVYCSFDLSGQTLAELVEEGEDTPNDT